MNNKSIMNHKSKRIISFLLALFLLALSPGSVAKAAGSGGLLKLTVTVSGLGNNSGVEVTAEKEIDGVMTYFKATTVSGVAEFTIPFGKTVRIYGEPISGYITPETTLSLTQLKGNLQKTCDLNYRSDGKIPVTGFSIEPEAASLIVGQTFQLNGAVLPLNASEKLVSWESKAPAIASIDATGKVTGVSAGDAIITATTADGAFTDTSTIKVMGIASLDSPLKISASPGSSTPLPGTVNATLTNAEINKAAVLWSVPAGAENVSLSSQNGIQYLILGSAATGEFSLSGDVALTDLPATLDVTVLGTAVVTIGSATLSAPSLSLYLEETKTLTLFVSPDGADTSALIWTNSNPLAVQMTVAADKKSAAIKGLANGGSLISVSLPGSSETLSTCYVTVAADPLLTDPAYIAATMENDPTPVEQFAEKEEVWIRTYGLDDGKYFIRVTGIGIRSPLGTGVIDVVSTNGVKEFKYNLNTAAPFDLTTKYSASYVVEMSKDKSFPSGDDETTLLPKTFKDNFKITSPVPTGQIVVNVKEVIRSTISVPSSNIVGNHVILCREIGLGTAAEYKDYVLRYDQGHPVFSDEAKMIGHVQKDGSVLWDTPKEKLKIGNYILLMELNGSYTSNLNEVNPVEEGLLKEVHILRNTTVYREIIVLSKDVALTDLTATLGAPSLSLYLGVTKTLTLVDISPAGADTSALIWTNSNPLAVQMTVAADKKSAAIKGLANGGSLISVSLPGSSETLSTCYVTVAADPLLTDPAYIAATMENDPTPVEQFAKKEEVWIRSYGLDDGKYFIRVTGKGIRSPLGTGVIDVVSTNGVKEFKYDLYKATQFKLTTKYSASYVVEMSKDKSFPSGDDEVTLLPKTFKDNFKITSPVPTGQIVVNVKEVIRSTISLPSSNIVGNHVILCREIDLGTAAEYKDYVLRYDQGHPVFSDEAKMIGHVQKDGSVLWDTPKEKLKIGNYILLMELNGSYTSNLNEVNPVEEGLLKEVHILRNTTVYREIIVSNQSKP